MSEKGLRTAFFISGGGTNMQAALDASREGKLKGLVDPVVAISSTIKAGGIKRAQDFGIPTYVVSYGRNSHVTEEILNILSTNSVDLCVLAGWIKLIPKGVIEGFKGDMLNIHPAPLDPGFPDFGGRGMYGLAPHVAVLLYSSITKALPNTESVVHQVTPEFDNGRILGIRSIPVTSLEGDSLKASVFEPTVTLESAQALQTALLPEEHLNLVDTLFNIGTLGMHNVPTISRETRLIDSQVNEAILFAVKEYAVRIAHSD